MEYGRGEVVCFVGVVGGCYCGKLGKGVFIEVNYNVLLSFSFFFCWRRGSGDANVWSWF